MDVVSILVRTCGRPTVLRNCLQSIKEQTYPEIEVVVVEDGDAISEDMIMSEFSDMNIHYFSTGVKVGRSAAGNIAIQNASGDYLNFLDDDDQFYETHIETLVNTLNETGKKIAYSIADEVTSSFCPHLKRHIEYRKKVRYRVPFNRAYLTMGNYLPIQTVMFSRVIAEQHGGFNEKLDYLEDWDLWMRYAFHEDFVYVPRVTSMYRVPLRGKRRRFHLNSARNQVLEEFKNYTFSSDCFRNCRELEYILRELKTPAWKKVIRKILTSHRSNKKDKLA